jgi:hypothetical protein
MAFNSDKDGIKKPKLPRKRKKAAIKVQGRKWYLDTIKLYKITYKSKMFYEPICKFWVNASVIQQPVIFNNDKIKLVPIPTKYW